MCQALGLVPEHNPGWCSGSAGIPSYLTGSTLVLNQQYKSRCVLWWGQRALARQELPPKGTDPARGHLESLQGEWIPALGLGG